MTPASSLFRRAFAASALLLVAGCAARPPIAPEGARFDLPPYLAAEQKSFDEREVLWGGMIISVTNRTDSTEITVLGYPLDRGQRPLLAGPTEGRFIISVPAFVEPLDYPEGRFLSVRGRIVGTREGFIDERAYVYPILRGATVHLWPQGFQYERPRFSIGIGIVR
jgi:outer membrane lipoprotein